MHSSEKARTDKQAEHCKIVLTEFGFVDQTRCSVTFETIV